ncbi:MAG: hypothetical protein H0X34_09715 [Chthoniobacterales bacterium]|nr:hypothetical protein [Chthoniobacterales bacterium]
MAAENFRHGSARFGLRQLLHYGRQLNAIGPGDRVFAIVLVGLLAIDILRAGRGISSSGRAGTNNRMRAAGENR